MNNILHKQWREDIFELLSIPSFNSNGINDCADYLYNQLNKIGLDVFIETEFGTPTIIARTKNQAKKNILFYSHFDVKPTGDCSLWVTSPFEPTIKDERIYCRGSGDAKGQVFALLKGIEKLINNNRLCSDLGISLILDGGEESGSVGLSKVCEKHAEFLN
ncbi:MAG TPA: M20/M25/M40 family metallo-hydrolase, partial [Candidatus Paceibacterota bacterium]